MNNMITQEYWFQVANAICWLFFLLAIAGVVIGAVLVIEGVDRRSKNPVRSDAWASGVLRLRDGIVFLVLALIFTMGVIFIPCDHDFSVYEELKHQQAVCEDNSKR